MTPKRFQFHDASVLFLSMLPDSAPHSCHETDQCGHEKKRGRRKRNHLDSAHGQPVHAGRQSLDRGLGVRRQHRVYLREVGIWLKEVRLRAVVCGEQRSKNAGRLDDLQIEFQRTRNLRVSVLRSTRRTSKKPASITSNEYCARSTPVTGRVAAQTTAGSIGSMQSMGAALAGEAPATAQARTSHRLARNALAFNLILL